MGKMNKFWDDYWQVIIPIAVIVVVFLTLFVNYWFTVGNKKYCVSQCLEANDGLYVNQLEMCYQEGRHGFTIQCTEQAESIVCPKCR